MVNKAKIICLMGPTASGKTQVAIELVKKFPMEIISVDSAMIYKTMNIGTAKPEPHILEIAPHFLIDIRDPAQSYSAACFCADAQSLIEDIISRNKIPLLVGGTMLYFQSLLYGLSKLPSANPIIRNEITAQAEKSGWPAMHEQLAAKDPESAKKIHPHDAQRIQRALEVFEVSGQTLTSLQKNNKKIPVSFESLNIVIAPAARSILHERIEKRFDQMLVMGFVDEVKSLFDRGDLSLEMPSVRSVGYRQFWEYLMGLHSLDKARDQAVFASRQFAKRQLTWLRAGENLIWFDSEDKLLLQKIYQLISL